MAVPNVKFVVNINRNLLSHTASVSQAQSNYLLRADKVEARFLPGLNGFKGN